MQVPGSNTQTSLMQLTHTLEQEQSTEYSDNTLLLD